MKFLITGNTGFKGAWLCLILKSMGYEVVGVALPAQDNSLFNKVAVLDDLSKQYYLDIRNQQGLNDVVKKENPDVVIHFAAQSLVRDSYLDPRKTIETNLMGTYNLLESLGLAKKLKSTLIITTDKVYKNLEQIKGYVEEDALGGLDPYSVSKSMADLLTQSWSMITSLPPIQIIRAGNVIGGGDFSKDRLIPDVISSIHNETAVKIRYPNSVRPWQHVFDCLGAYLKILDYSLNSSTNEIWNVGPAKDSFRKVSDVVISMSKYIKFNYEYVKDVTLHEASLLTLDVSKIEQKLNWSNSLEFDESIEITASWYIDYLAHANLRKVSLDQVNKFF